MLIKTLCITLLLFLASCMQAHTPWHADYQGDEPTKDVPFNGIVTDLMGLPVKGVRIWVKDERRYAMSNKKGHFGLTNVGAADTLHLRYKKTRYDIPVEGKLSIRIRLADQLECSEDEQLVDLGYGFVKQRECTTSRGGISGEELIRSGKTNILAALQGRVAGLSISTSGAPGDPATATIRGVNSINLDTTPLFVVDGVVVSTLDMISVFDVDYVEVMREAGIYGARGANGAIIVHTKKGVK